MRRFLVKSSLEPGARVLLDGEESRHAVKALRLKAGATILLTDGQGKEAEARISSVSAEGLEAVVISVKKSERTVSLELMQAPLKGPKMDWLVEKLTEIGVSKVHLVKTRHTVAAGEKIERWQRVAQSAVKQSGNPRLPQIQAIESLQECVSHLKGTRILLQPGAPQGLAATVKEAIGSKTSTILLAVGPEGGFSAEEEEEMIQAGFIPAAISLQILRGETAAIAALAIAAHSIDF